MNKVFITKYWETKGVVEADVIRYDPPGVLVRDYENRSHYIGASHWFNSRQSAENKISSLAAKKVIKLENKIVELKKLIKP